MNHSTIRSTSDSTLAFDRGRRAGRFAVLMLIWALAGPASGCAVSEMLPQGPVVPPEQRSSQWTGRPSGVEYTGPVRVDHPVLPLMVFAVPYDLDIVLVSKHPAWGMHEYARVHTPDGFVWLAKDSRRANGNQLLVAGDADLAHMLPEIPLRRRIGPVRVAGRIDERYLDVSIAYRNYAREPVRVEYEGPAPRPVSKRNGSTMGHSRHQALAVLDLSHRSFGRRASIRIDGRYYPLARLFGIVEQAFALKQVQGGIADAQVVQRAVDGELVTRHRGAANPDAPYRWTVRRTERHVEVRQSNDLRTLVYQFLRPGGGRLELHQVRVRFWDREEPIFRLEFQPALPDVRRPFDGVAKSRWVMDVGRRTGHGIGKVRVRSTERGAELRFRGSRPWWVASRCARATVVHRADAAVEMSTDVEPCGD